MHGIAADGNIPAQNLNGYIAAAIGILGFLNASVCGKLIFIFAVQKVFTFFRQRERMVRIKFLRFNMMKPCERQQYNRKTRISAVTTSKIFVLFFIQS